MVRERTLPNQAVDNPIGLKYTPQMLKLLKSAVKIVLPSLTIGPVTVFVVQVMGKMAGFELDPRGVFMAGCWASMLTLTAVFVGFVSGGIEVE